MIPIADIINKFIPAKANLQLNEFMYIKYIKNPIKKKKIIIDSYRQ